MIVDEIKQLMQSKELSQNQMQQAMGSIMDGKATDAQIAAFLIALRCKGETAAEISGAAKAMRERMTPIAINKHPLLDTCGTGGDNFGTFNISTTVAFVAAANGICVAKHGNKASSSKSGSADVLAALGVNIDASLATVEKCLHTLGIGFLYAPHCHPAMKNAAHIRRELGVRTIFNILGPLTNPANADRQLLGVFDKTLLRPMAEALGQLGSQHVWIVHGKDGMDEITLCDETYVAEWHNEKLKEFILAPEDFGLKRCTANDLLGGTPQENAELMRKILAGQGPQAHQDAVALNAGAALFLCEVVPTMQKGITQAQATLRSGKALQILDRLIELSSINL